MVSILLVGLNHRTAAIDLREQFSLTGCGLRIALADLAGFAAPAGHQHGQAPLQEAVILSTCNRLELYATAADPEAGRAAMEHFLCQIHGISPALLQPHLYFDQGRSAVWHLMRVASGVDSMILGESQILGQVARAHAEAHTAGVSGPLLSHLFNQAVHCGKRARTETAIGSYTTSLSHAAAQRVAADLHNLDGVHALVIGAGEMGELAALALRHQGIGSITCINRTYTRAEQVAQRVDGRALGWHQLEAALAEADVVITATSAPHQVLSREQIARALAQRKSWTPVFPNPDHLARPLLLVDIALPRDIDPAVDDLPGVVRYDIDHLRDAVDANRARREAAVPQVERIVDEEVDSFLEWSSGRQVVPALVELRRKAQTLADAELERTLRRLDCGDPRVEDEVKQLAHRLVNKLLHDPTVRLKAEAANGNGVVYAEVLKELFALEAPAGSCRAERRHG